MTNEVAARAREQLIITADDELIRRCSYVCPSVCVLMTLINQHSRRPHAQPLIAYKYGWLALALLLLFAVLVICSRVSDSFFAAEITQINSRTTIYHTCRSARNTLLMVSLFEEVKLWLNSNMFCVFEQGCFLALFICYVLNYNLSVFVASRSCPNFAQTLPLVNWISNHTNNTSAILSEFKKGSH